eukprot:snap_masked-scaffold_1-processed-gene-5.7-mRNA-1 protein AED:1.00 eAED:1.00 QI:0/0/0/0/1/1/2/0/59
MESKLPVAASAIPSNWACGYELKYKSSCMQYDPSSGFKLLFSDKMVHVVQKQEPTGSFF